MAGANRGVIDGSKGADPSLASFAVRAYVAPNCCHFSPPERRVIHASVRPQSISVYSPGWGALGDSDLSTPPPRVINPLGESFPAEGSCPSFRTLGPGAHWQSGTSQTVVMAMSGTRLAYAAPRARPQPYRKSAGPARYSCNSIVPLQESQKQLRERLRLYGKEGPVMMRAGRADRSDRSASVSSEPRPETSILASLYQRDNGRRVPFKVLLS